MNGLKEIVLVSHWFGHSPHCLECVLPYFLERGWQVYHLTDKPDDAAKYFSECGLADHEKIRHLGMVEVQPSKPTRRRDAHLCRVEAHWQGVRVALEGLFAELGRKVGIFHTWVDLYSHEYLSRRVIAEAMPAPWVGLYVHPAELRIQKTWKRRAYENAMDLLKMGRIFPSRLKAFNVPNARRIYFLDELLVGKARQYFHSAISLSAFPEWIDSNVAPNFAELERISKLAGDRKIISLCGFLSKRKGLLTLLQAAKSGLEGWFFIFAGPIDWESFSVTEKSMIQKAQAESGFCFAFMDRQLQDCEINSIVQRSDFIYIAYENFFHSSNVQVKAAFYGKPMLAGPQHLIAERTHRFEMGWCLPEISSDAVETLLRKISLKEIDAVAKKARFREFLSEHTPEVLEKKLDEIVAAAGSTGGLMEPPITPINTKI